MMFHVKREGSAERPPLTRLYHSTMRAHSWASSTQSVSSRQLDSTAAKVLWLREHLPAIDDIRIVAYGTPKSTVVKDVRRTDLFDDELANRTEFERAGGQARLPRNIFRFMLAKLAREC